MKDVDFFAPGARLALELECLLLDTRDAAAQSRWWDSAHEALEQWRQAVLAMEAADAAHAVQGEPVAYIRKEDFDFILADDKSEPYGARQAPVFSRNACRAPVVPLYASPQPPAQGVEALLRQALEALEFSDWYTRAKAKSTIAALRERLSEGEPR